MEILTDISNGPSVIVAFETNSGVKRFLGAVQSEALDRQDPGGKVKVPLGPVRTAIAFGWSARLEGLMKNKQDELTELAAGGVHERTEAGLTIDTATPPSKAFGFLVPQLTFEAMPKDAAIAIEHSSRGGRAGYSA
jgi:hypothetical protein